MEIFIQIGLIFIVAAVGAYLARLLRQPLIPAYIIAGALLGPVFGLGTSENIITTFSEIGIAFLLFTVGLELDLKKLKGSGNTIIAVGMIQMAALFIVGFWISLLFGLSMTESIVLGIAVALSSTMVVVKILSDKRELETLHGRIIVGILLLQDVVAIIALSLLSKTPATGITASAENVLKSITGEYIASALPFILPLIKGAGMVAIAVILGKYAFPRLFTYAARSQELLILLALAVCFSFSLGISALGLSITIGAFIAGVSLAHLSYNLEIIGKVRSLRDFFATLFFVSLGMALGLDNMENLIPTALALLAAVVILKPLIVMSLLALLRFTKKTSFMTGFSLAQISEFSLIMAAQGLAAGSLSKDVFTLTVLIAVASIALTSYFISFEQHIYRIVSPLLDALDISTSKHRLQYTPGELEGDVLLIGYDRIGYSIFKTITQIHKSFLVIDYNPDIIKSLVSRRISCLYGDISDPEILERINLRKTEMVISTVPAIEDTIYLIRRVKSRNPHANIFVTASTVADAMHAYKEGADYVILPHLLGGEKVADLIKETHHDKRRINLNKLSHIDQMKQRIETMGERT